MQLYDGGLKINRNLIFSACQCSDALLKRFSTGHEPNNAEGKKNELQQNHLVLQSIGIFVKIRTLAKLDRHKIEAGKSIRPRLH